MSGPRFIAIIAIAALSLAIAFVAPIICVLPVVVALNLILGERENVPFSVYGMFSRPRLSEWTVRFEDQEGAPVRIALFGVNPQDAVKRFASVLHEARSRGEPLPAARRHAADVLAADLERSADTRGIHITHPIMIAVIDYSLESGQVEIVRTPLVEVPPR